MPDTTRVEVGTGPKIIWIRLAEVGTLRGMTYRGCLKWFRKKSKAWTLDLQYREVKGRGGTHIEINLDYLPPEDQVLWRNRNEALALEAQADAEIDRQTDGPRRQWAHAQDKKQKKALKRQAFIEGFRQIHGSEARAAYFCTNGR